MQSVRRLSSTMRCGAGGAVSRGPPVDSSDGRVQVGLSGARSTISSGSPLQASGMNSESGFETATADVVELDRQPVRSSADRRHAHVRFEELPAVCGRTRPAEYVISGALPTG